MPGQPYSLSNCKFSVFRMHISYFNPEGGTPNTCREAPPKEGSIFRLQADKRVGISLVEKYEGERNRSFRSVRGTKKANRCFFVAEKKSRGHPCLAIF